MMEEWNFARWALVLSALIVVGLACSFGAGSADPSPTVPTMPPGPTNTPVSFMPEPTEAPTEDPGQCEPPPEEIEVGAAVEGQVSVEGDTSQSRVYYCVMIPQKTSRAVFELSGTTAPLNLYVGYPDLETVQSGGVLYWSDTGGEEGDKRVVAEMGVRDFLHAGPYYIEVSPDNSNESSNFTLLVTIEQP